MNDLTIFWHHVGREHGFGEYGLDLRKNSDKVIRQYLDFKIQRVKSGVLARRFVRVDDETLVELAAPEAREELFIPTTIKALRSLELALTQLHAKQFPPAWLRELVTLHAPTLRTRCE